MATLSAQRAAYREQLRQQGRAIVERGMACSYPVGTRVLERSLREDVPEEARPHLSALRRAMDERQPIADHLYSIAGTWPRAFR